MENVVLYMLKFSIAIAILTTFYYLFLRKTTFYHINRVYLVAVVAMSVILPSLDISTLLSNDGSSSRQVLHSLPAINNLSFSSGAPTDTWNSFTLIFIIAICGSLVLLIRFAAQYAALLRLKRNSNLLQIENGMSIFDTNENVSGFSFGNNVFIRKELYTDDELRKIISHEAVHVRSHHTTDLLLSELVCIVNWYNPFAWMLKKFIRQNLEFLADEAVVSGESDSKEYQYLLLRSAAVAPHMPVNAFGAQNLKKRIVMMNKMKSSRSVLLRFTVLVPVLVCTSLLFRSSQLVAQPTSPVTIRAVSGITIHSDESQDRPLYIVDDWVQPAAFETKYIKAQDIISVSVWKGNEAVKKFGEAAKPNGAIQIVTKLPLYVVNGVIQMKMSDVQIDNIASVNVLKGEEGRSKYPHRNENGIVEITTKKEK